MTWARKDMHEEGRRRRMRVRRRRRNGHHTNSNNPTLKGGEKHTHIYEFKQNPFLLVHPQCDNCCGYWAARPRVSKQNFWEEHSKKNLCPDWTLR